MKTTEIALGEIISYLQMCQVENYTLQRGMNFKIRGGISVILMSVRKGAPYLDKIVDDGRTLIYEGHDVPRNETKFPKLVDQQLYSQKGKITQNGKFYNAAKMYFEGRDSLEYTKVYEKIKDGIWVYNGVFELLDAWTEIELNRSVFKFKLSLSDKQNTQRGNELNNIVLDHNRIIPTNIKLQVWKRDKGKCIHCGSKNNLHFDHILPYSKGGTSLLKENIQLLCARHNLEKSANIL